MTSTHLTSHNQRLSRPAPGSPSDVVGWLCAVQSQDYAGAKWGVGRDSGRPPGPPAPWLRRRHRPPSARSGCSRLLGSPNLQNEVCYYSVPAEPIDFDMNVVYHKGIFNDLLRKLGYRIAVPDPGTM